MFKIRKKDLLSVSDLSTEEFRQILSLAQKLKDENHNGINRPYLAGKTLGMLFMKPSTRTRISFEVGMYQLGGHALYLASSELQLARGETIADTAKVLSRYLHGVLARVHSHDYLRDLARNSDIPVINGLSDLEHPCQAISDIFTVLEKRKLLRGLKIAFIGDANNVANSLMLASSSLGIDFAIATPTGYEPSRKVLDEATERAHGANSMIIHTHDPIEAAKDADVVYTDVWVSMGHESEIEERKKAFRPFQVNTSLMANAKKDVIFMHCLPAHRGDEVTPDVIDGPGSVIFTQAENRLHVQKAILIGLLS